MSALANWIARLLWGHMLWAMRRPWLKSLGRAAPNMFGEPRRARMLDSMKRQNRFARRIGLPLLTTAITLLLASVILTTSYLTILRLYESGYLQPIDPASR